MTRTAKGVRIRVPDGISADFSGRLKTLGCSRRGGR